MSKCGDCIRFEKCQPYVTENECFPEEKGGCKAFKRKTKISQLYYKLLSITNRNEFIKTLRNARKDYDDEPSSM